MISSILAYAGIPPKVPLDRPVAIKVLSEKLTDHHDVLDRFNRESLIIARLNHPNIIHVIDRGIMPEGMPYFVMEHVEGSDLAKAIKADNLDTNRKQDLVVQVCKALSYAHKNGVIHRDIKPSNVLIDADGNALVLDFGIAKLFDGGTHLAPNSLGLDHGDPGVHVPRAADGYQQCDGCE